MNPEDDWVPAQKRQPVKQQRAPIVTPYEKAQQKIRELPGLLPSDYTNLGQDPPSLKKKPLARKKPT
jgi:hypothetical protein